MDKNHDDFAFRGFYDHFWHMSVAVATGRVREHSGGADDQQQESLEPSASCAASVD